MSLELPSALIEQMLSLAVHAQEKEIVGLVAGPELGRGTQLYPLNNISPTPIQEYLADPAELIRALASIRQLGLELVAIYHSHPEGPATPSRKDITLAQWDAPYIIIDTKNKQVRAWQLMQPETNAQPKEIKLLHV